METLKSFFGYLAIAISIVLFGLFVKMGMDNRTYSGRSITAKGVSEQMVTATDGTAYLYLSVQGDNLSEVKENSNNQVNTIKSFIKKFGFEDKDIEVRTEIADRHKDYVGEIIYRPVERYSSMTYMVIYTKKVKELYELQSNLSSIIDEYGILLDNSNFDYQYNDLDSIKPQMLTEATASARKSAEQFAIDSNSKTGKIKSANQGYFSIEPEQGELPYILKVRVVVTAEFYLN